MKTWIQKSSVFIIILPIITYLYIISNSPKNTINSTRRYLISREEYVAYHSPISSPALEEWMQHQHQLGHINDDRFDEFHAYKRRRLPGPVFTTASPTGPTQPPTPQPTPYVNTLDFDDTNPYIVVNFDGHVPYDYAANYCVTQLGTDLASVDKYDSRRTQAEQILAMSALCAIGAGAGVECWIGLKFNDECPGDTTLCRFHWENGQLLKVSNGSEENWLGDDVDGDGTQDGSTPLYDDIVNFNIRNYCIALFPHPLSEGVYYWQNVDCVHPAPDEIVHAAICDNPDYINHPTDGPTTNPSKVPSETPTKAPIKQPTTNPSKAPSGHPTTNPSKVPSINPTKVPTDITSYPTISPTTSKPTTNPSKVPSKTPTKSPTKQPTINPSKAPSKTPTGDPTISPSKPPSKNPTKQPTTTPSKAPSQDPTISPTTRTPTTRTPTQTPTAAPTDVTVDPTISPTTRTPTTRTPTQTPTAAPTDVTADPTISPTTKQPTTRSPTTNPSKAPSDDPTISPTTRQPTTKSPSETPTTAPTDATIDPTRSPTTKEPTTNPSAVPTESTSNPSLAPTTKQPTTMPSKTPTKVPSKAPTPMPTHPGEVIAPTKVSNVDYNGGQLKFQILLPFDGDLIFDVTDNDININYLQCFVNNAGNPGAHIATDGEGTDQDATPFIIRMNNIPPGYYLCIVQGVTSSGTVNATIGAESDSPTKSPTGNPTTSNPTSNPTTSEPTAAPTDVTSQPTISPTKQPTKQPTTNPSKVPSKSPTGDPTISPSKPPSKNPTTTPSKAPSQDPTMSPTTRTPTTRTPTQTPTAAPTDVTVDPTISPTTKQPTTRTPTQTPTAAPTDVTADPTISPTTKQPTTRSPTTNPSKAPSDDPTISPTTRQPTTKSPSETPTTAPTDTTIDPTISPTTRQPTKYPSTAPTKVTPSPTDDTISPSTTPTTAEPTTSPPTINPTTTPTADTGAPSKTPTRAPTDVPSDNPTPAPTDQPTKPPSKQPSSTPTDVTMTPTETPSNNPTEMPTYSPTENDDACGDDRKEWEISFPCPGQPIFQLVSTCPSAYAVRLSLDRIFEVDRYRRDVRNSCNSWGRKKRWKYDLDFMWDGGNLGDSVGLDTVDGEEREVIRNKFSARLNNNRLRGRGGKRIQQDAWMNITVFFFIDERGGTFDLRNTGDPDDYITVEAFTLKYIIDSVNWPFQKNSDLLAMQFTAQLIQVSRLQSNTLWTCWAYNGGGGGYHGGGGYGSMSSSKKKSKGSKGKGKGRGGKGGGYGGNPYSTKKRGKKKKKKGHSSSRRRMVDELEADSMEYQHQRQLLHYNAKWDRNEYERGSSGHANDGYGAYKGSSYSYSKNVASYASNYAFGVDFRFESILKALIDKVKKAIDSKYLGASDMKTTVIHYFPRFIRLAFDGACIFYRPTWEYWAKKGVTNRLPGNVGNGNHRAFGGEDVNSNPEFKTKPQETENGFFTKLWNSMSWLNWIFVFGGIFLLTICVCSCCGWVWYKIKQNTHENNSFVKLE